jgi:hypothetical protein
MLRVTYSCDSNPNKRFYIDREANQIKNKWGEWVTNDYYIRKEIVVKLCQEEKRDEEIRKKVIEKEEERIVKEKERIAKEEERLLKEEANLGREWIAYERDDSGKYSYDNKHIKMLDSNVIQVWSKQEINFGKVKWLLLNEINCSKKTNKIVRNIFYKAEYNPYENTIDTNIVPTNVKDRSAEMILLKKVCSKEKIEEVIREQAKSEHQRQQEEKERIRKEQEKKELMRKQQDELRKQQDEIQRIEKQKKEIQSKKIADENWERYKRQQEEKERLKKQ